TVSSPHLDLHSFPTRRSSDLRAHSALKQLDPHGWIDEHVTGLDRDAFHVEENGKAVSLASFEEIKGTAAVPKGAIPPPGVYTNRSEEHTSELQSRSDLVCRLL